MLTIGGEKRRALLFACVSRTSVNESHFSEPMKVSFIERKILRCVKVKGLSGSLYVLCASRFDNQRSRTMFSKAFLYNNRALRAFKFGFAATRWSWAKDEKRCKELLRGITKIVITNLRRLAIFLTTNILMLSEEWCGFDRNKLLERFDRPPADSCRHFVYSDADIPELIARVDISNKCLLVREKAMVSAENFETRWYRIYATK